MKGIGEFVDVVNVVPILNSSGGSGRRESFLVRVKLFSLEMKSRSMPLD